MRSFIYGTTAAVMLAILTSTTATAQENPKDAAKSEMKVGFVDLEHVYNKHPTFNAALLELKAKVDRANEEVEQKKEELRNKVEQLKMQVVGTPEYVELEKKIVAFKAETLGQVETEKMAFVRREAKIYNRAYEEIIREVGAYAEENDITLVMRIKEPSGNAGDPKLVLERINRPIVWYDKKHDITRAIVQRLVEKSKKTDTTEQEPEGPKEPEDEKETPAEETPAS